MSPVPTGNPTIRRALLFARPIAHKNHIIQLNGRLTCGPGLNMAMEPGSYPSWHANCTHPGSSLGLAVPCSPSWHAMVGPGCDRKITRTPPLRHWCLVSNLHPVRAMLLQTSHIPTYGSLLADIHLARVAVNTVNILDDIIRLGQYGTKR